MKKILSTLFVAAHLLPAMASASPVEVPSPVHKIFVPDGFDDNDNVEVVLHGEFPTSCYQVGRTAAKVNEAKREITVWAFALQYPGGESCADVKVPFTQSVKIGLLAKGDYQVVLQADPSIEARLPITARHVEAPEDYLYAPVVNASLAKNSDGRQNLTISGHYPYMFVGCMVIDEVRTRLTSSNVLVVQPIAKIEQDGSEACDKQAGDKSFKVSQELATPLQGEGLIHVRVLNGDSLNQFVPTN